MKNSPGPLFLIHREHLPLCIHVKLLRQRPVISVHQSLQVKKATHHCLGKCFHSLQRVSLHNGSAVTQKTLVSMHAESSRYENPRKLPSSHCSIFIGRNKKWLATSLKKCHVQVKREGNYWPKDKSLKLWWQSTSQMFYWCFMFFLFKLFWHRTASTTASPVSNQTCFCFLVFFGAECWQHNTVILISCVLAQSNHWLWSLL